MIIDLQRFIQQERPYWSELELLLKRLEDDAGYRLPLSRVRRLHYLYERASADLARIATFSAAPEVKNYLETLVARAYAEVHDTRDRMASWRWTDWFLRTFPRTFRIHASAFWMALAVTIAGAAFGVAAMQRDGDAKEILIPFGHLQGSPSERVRQEEAAAEDRLAGQRITFSSVLMTHNIRVSILALALGVSFGIGTMLLLFYNGIMLGAVTADYIAAGETQFLLGWLLPHGAVEIPAILLSGQAGLVLAGALIGWGNLSLSLRDRLRAVSGDLTTLIGGVAILLVWAGLVEAFLSQYHAPVLSYQLKIAFGLLELTILSAFLALSGRRDEESP